MKLKSETNTPEMGKRIELAFSGVRPNVPPDEVTAVFEHGQWWISCLSGAQYSVVDAIGGDSIDGFDFEQVSEGEEP